MKKIKSKTAETFDAVHELENSGMPRDQAESTVRIVDRQAAELISQAIDEFNARFDSLEKRLAWLSIESLVAITVIGAGFVGVIFAILQLN